MNKGQDSFDMSRRAFLGTGITVSVGLMLSGCGSLLKGDVAAEVGATPVSSPEQALQRLQEGNRRFTAGKSVHPDLTPARLQETTVGGQHPFATILGCSDSRVPPEAIFDQGVGDLFVVRVAGNVADTDEIATAEYGCGHLGTPLLVVMGHTKCGAVTAVVKGEEVGGSLPRLVDNIIAPVKRAKAKKLEGDALIDAAIRENVRQSISDLQKRSKELSHLLHEGKLKVVGAIYHIDSGEVEWI